MSIWTITSMNIPFDSIVEPPALAENCSIGFSSRQLPQSPERMMHLSRASGQRGQETAICSGYASQGDTPIHLLVFRFCLIAEPYAKIDVRCTN